MWLKLLSMGIKTGSHLYQNRQRTKMLMSDAERLHAEKLANGELEYKKEIISSNDKGIKDEIVLIVVLLPVCLLGYSVFSDDPDIKMKIDLFFEYFSNLPYFYQFIFVSVICAIYGIKATDVIKRK
tara:strand:- start:659 stop:1036 length:378 start_codon:yes stop_codon:yes gene_type:complete